LNRTVDYIIKSMTNEWLDNTYILYENTIFSIIYSFFMNKNNQFQHACLASDMITLFPNNEMYPCYMHGSNEAFNMGTFRDADNFSKKRNQLQEKLEWKNNLQRKPWYWNIIGDYCLNDVTDMNKDSHRSLYHIFNDVVSSRVLSWIPVIYNDPIKLSRIKYAMNLHINKKLWSPHPKEVS
jgi:sulfatase maturation enzyme AslB (radical SAM superfamily)